MWGWDIVTLGQIGIIVEVDFLAATAGSVAATGLILTPASVLILALAAKLLAIAIAARVLGARLLRRALISSLTSRHAG